MNKALRLQLKRNELREASVHFGYNIQTFTVMRSTYPDKFEYIYNYDTGSFINAFKLYQEDNVKVHEDAQFMYEKLKRGRKITEFSKLLCDKGLYGNEKSFIGSAKTTLYGSEGFSNHDTLLQYKRILEVYDEFRV